MQNLGSFAMKPDMYIWSRSIRSEKTVEGKVAQWSAQLLYRTLEMSCQISESACELPNGCHLDPSLHISLSGIGVLGSVARPSQVDTLQCHYQLDWRRGWRPTPVFLPGESHGQRSLPGYSSQSHTELDTAEALTYNICFSLSDSFIPYDSSRFIHLTITDSNPFLFMAE